MSYKQKSRLLVLFLAVLGFAANAAADDANFVREFDRACFNIDRVFDLSGDADVNDGWRVLSDLKEFPSFLSYHEIVQTKLTHHSDRNVVSLHKSVDGKDLFLIKFKSSDSNSAARASCVVADFARDDWRFPAEMDALLEEKANEFSFSRKIINGSHSIGIWTAKKFLRPIKSINASAYTIERSEGAGPTLQIMASAPLPK